MKRNFFIGLFFVVLAFGMNGCVNAVEEITFNKDGSGTYALEMDMGGMISMLQGMGGLDGILGGEGDNDGEGESNPMSKLPEKQDTIIAFADVAKENGQDISTMERKHIWETAKTHMKIDQKAGIMKVRMYFDFKSADDIVYFQKNLSKLRGGDDAGGMGDLSGMMSGMGGAQSSIEFAKRLFSRTTPKVDSPMDDEQDESMEMVKMFLGSAKYKTVYHFPRRVKSTTIKGAKISDDQKTVTTEIGFLEMLENNQLLDGKVKLKRR